MLNFLGSQFGIILFLIIGAIVIYAINSFSKEKMSNEDTQSTLISFGGIGFIVSVVCFILYECTHAE